MKHFTDQCAITVIATVDAGKLDYLEALLKKIRDEDIEDNSILPFKKLGGVHFCRFLILPGFQNGTIKVTDQLAYSSNFDVSEEAHFSAITQPEVLSGFHQLFSCCSGFQHNLAPREAVIDFVKRYRQTVHTFYRGHRGLSLELIKKEYALYQCVQDFLDTTDVKGLNNQQIKERIEGHVKKVFPTPINCPDIRLPHRSIPLVAFLYVILPILVILTTSYFLGIFLYTFLALFIGIAGIILYLRYLEVNAKELPAEGNTIKDSQKKTKILTTFEDFQVQNQLSHLVELRPGIFRRAMQIFALAALKQLAIYTYNKGRLGDIATIHFARWSLIDKGKRLLFFSNFDGSWENYLGDFVDRAAVGLTLAWSNTREFPRSKFLFLEGATNEELFKTWTREYQIITQVWYTAYKDLTVKNIFRNHQIALGMGREMSENQVKEWIKLL